MTIVRISRFSGKSAKANKNGALPLYLTYVSGDVLPENSRVLDGTVAKSENLEEGKTYMINVNPSGTEWEGKPQFNVSNINEVSGSDLLTLFASQVSKVNTVTYSTAEKTTAQASAGVGNNAQ